MDLTTILVVALIIGILWLLIRAGAKHEKAENERRRKEREARLEEEERKKKVRGEKIKEVQFVSSGEYIRRHKIIQDFGWVEGNSFAKRSELEDELKFQAAEKGANGLIKFTLTRGSEREIAGFGHKGNPYYATVTRFAAEALAVKAVREDLKTPSRPPRLSLDRTENVLLIDGSNLLYWLNDEPHPGAIRALAQELRARRITFSVYFDANAEYVLKKFTEGSARKFGDVVGLLETEMVIVPAGSQADPFILQRAESTGGGVISNDRFRDYTSLHPWTQAADRIHKGTVHGGQLTIPTLKIDIPVSEVRD